MIIRIMVYNFYMCTLLEIEYLFNSILLKRFRVINLAILKNIILYFDTSIYDN